MDESNDEGLVRIQSLEAWSTPVVNCTADVVLGLVQNHRRGLYAFPALAGSAFVFDEIHAYDDRLFGALLRFLAAMPNVPVLLMTASLPQRRLQSLQECLKKRGTELKIIPGPADIEEIPRYRWDGNLRTEFPLSEIQTELENHGKVLWVCNTVSRAMEAAQIARNAGLEPLIYHSRFRYKDRVEQHKEQLLI